MYCRATRRLARVVTAMAICAAAAACGSSSVNVAAPSAAKCQVSATSSIGSAPAAGASGTVTVATTRDCTWSASSSAAWIAITSAATGQGGGSVEFRVEPNGDRTARHGTLAVNDDQISIEQDPAPCRFTVTATSTTIGAAGGRVAIQVATSGGCAWQVTSQAAWITAGAGGSGNGAASLDVAANAGAERTGTVVVAGQTITIAQAAVGTPEPPAPPPGPTPAPAPTPCSFSVAPLMLSVAAGGDTVPVAVSAGPSCTWTAESHLGWVSIASGASGSGDGTASVRVAANSDNARTGRITIAGQSVTVSQAAAACAFAIAPSSASVPAAGGGGSVHVAVTAGGGCAWTAASSAPWIVIANGGTGTGDGNVAFTVDANGGGARSGTITIAGQRFTVTQAAAPAPCSYAISPTGQNVAAGGGTGSVAVTADGACGWTAASNVPWIAITSAASASGNGTVAFTVAANGGPARSGTMTIGGQTFTVNQAGAAAPCTYSIAPASASVDPAGGTGSVAVTTDAACAWTATSNAPDWITVTSGASGSGNGSVGFSAAANTGGARSGTITIGGQTFTLSQAAPPPPPPPPPPPACSFSIAPNGQTVPMSGGGGSISVTASAANCTWTTASNAPDWIAITSGASGTGSGGVTFTAAASPDGSARSGTITVAGQTFTVSQSSPPPSP